MSREEAIARAQKLAPRLAERADRCVADRRAPDETIQEFKDAGLIRLSQPKRFGGFELGWDVMCEVIQILAAACGSQGWVYRVLVDHAWTLGTFPLEAQHDVWGDDADVLLSSSFAPVGRATSASGGYRFSGRLGFSSGIDHADWVICGGVVEDTGEARYFIIPKEEGAVVDDWYVNGLEGTGSKSFRVEDAFVPAHRTMSMALAAAGRGLGTEINTAPLYRLPRAVHTTAGFSALAVGMAKGCLEGWLSAASKRKIDGAPAASIENLQIVAGHAASEIAAAELLYLTTIREAMRTLNAHEEIFTDDVHQTRCNFAFVNQLVIAAAVRLYNAGGASLMYRGNPIERQFRNIMAGGQHVAVNWPKGAGNYGAMLMIERGAPIEPPEKDILAKKAFSPAPPA